MHACLPAAGLPPHVPACTDMRADGCLWQVDRTVLFFPRSLSSIYGNAMAWSYMGGFLT